MDASQNGDTTIEHLSLSNLEDIIVLHYQKFSTTPTSTNPSSYIKDKFIYSPPLSPKNER